MKRQQGFLICSVWLLLLGRGDALSQEDIKPLDPKMVDQKLYDALRDVINHGADVYNRGDWAGCHRLYAGALMTSQAMLAHRPELQKAIAEGLRAADAEPVISEKAFVLRRVLDKVRADLRGDAPPVVPVAKATVKGKVTLDDKPLAGGDVFVIDSKGAIKKARIAPDGTYAVSDLAPGAYKVAVDGKDVPAKFKDAEKSGLDTVLKAGDNPYDLSLKRDTPPPPASGTVKGKVTLNGKPLEDGTVTYIDKDNKSAEGKVKDGSYEIKDLKPGDYKVTIKGTGVPAMYADAAKTDQTFAVKSGSNTKDYDLKADKPTTPAATVSGVVTLDGKPLGEGEVFFIDIEGTVKSGKIDKDGAYKVANVPAGAYKVAFDAKGIPPKYKEAATSGFTPSLKAGDNTLNLPLVGDKPPPSSGTVKGSVKIDDKPLTAGTIIFVDKDDKSTEGKITDGAYEVKGLKPGDYTVAVKGTGVPAKYTEPDKSGLTVTVKDGNNPFDPPIKADAPPPPPPSPPPTKDGSVMGKVTLKGQPLKDGDVILVNEDGKSSKGKINPDGTFLLEKLKPGRYKVVIEGDGVPAKYQKEDTSPYTVDVKEGRTEADYNLE
jgi:hypothetical protein